jgi:hypothetical protein
MAVCELISGKFLGNVGTTWLVGKKKIEVPVLN